MVNSCELGRATKNLNDIDQDKKKQKKAKDSGAEVEKPVVDDKAKRSKSPKKR